MRSSPQDDMAGDFSRAERGKGKEALEELLKRVPNAKARNRNKGGSKESGMEKLMA